tara:strand:- start:941 stop:1660 length:720 start_codon:yes stop_codon:yes gene_type:complete
VKKKNLIFASASFHPKRKNIIKKKKDLLQREEDYLFCLKQLIRVVPNNFEIHIVDNTIKGSDSLFNSELRSFLKDLNVTYSFETNKKEVKNIGVGELKELFYLENILDFSKYSKICYLTSRRFITNPYVFEKTEQLKKEALLSNPDFIYLDGQVIPSEKKGMYNDMFFAMTSKTMQEYISFSKDRIDYLDDNLINSETNLYDFITKFNIPSEFLMFLGFFRYDYYRKNDKENKHKYHFV